jgi:hypothetical protein
MFQEILPLIAAGTAGKHQHEAFRGDPAGLQTIKVHIDSG